MSAAHVPDEAISVLNEISPPRARRANDVIELAPRRPTAPDSDDEAFWSSRPELEHIRAFALSKRVSPWSTLGVVLVRVVTATSHNVVLPPLVGSVASLNLFLGLVARSGDGKGTSVACGTDAVDLGVVNAKTHTVGSGQGIAHAYAHRDKKTGELERHAYAALFVVDEIDTLAGSAKQTGSTTLAELRRLFMGERLGQLFVDPLRRVEIDPHTYRAGLIVGIQAPRAGVLLDDADGGTPQRFVWLPTAYPHPDVRPAEPKPWRWRQPALPRGRFVIPVCATAEQEIDAAALARARGEGEALDGHRLLTREKVAAALGLLNSRAEISEEDWRLSDIVMGISDRTRAAVVAELTFAAQQRNATRAHADGARQLIVADKLEQAAIARVSRAVIRHLGDGSWESHAALRRRLRSTDRDLFGEAVEHLIIAGQLEREDVDDARHGGARYRLHEAAR